MGSLSAQEYMQNIFNAAGTKLVDGHPLWSGIEGHKRLAREIGCALGDFDIKGQKEILISSYSVIYVRSCSLKPLLDSKEWVTELKKGAAARNKFAKI